MSKSSQRFKKFQNTKTIERGKYQRIRHALEEFDGLRLDVGYFAGQQGGDSDSKFLLPDIAAVQEYGSKPSKKFRKVPARSFMRSTFDQFKRVYSKQFLREGFRSVLGNKTPKKALLAVGQDYRSDMMNKITGIRNPKNAPWTIKNKGVDNPLIDSGTMRSSIRMRVGKLAR